MIDAPIYRVVCLSDDDDKFTWATTALFNLEGAQAYASTVNPLRDPVVVEEIE